MYNLSSDMHYEYTYIYIHTLTHIISWQSLSQVAPAGLLPQFPGYQYYQKLSPYLFFKKITFKRRLAHTVEPFPGSGAC